jgi:hypothetical protein
MLLSLIAVLTPGSAAFGQNGGNSVEIVDRAIEYHGGYRYQWSRTRLELCSRPGCYEISATVQGGLFEYRVRGPVRGGVREVLASNDRLLHWHNDGAMEVPSERQTALRDWAMGRVYFAFLP